MKKLKRDSKGKLTISFQTTGDAWRFFQSFQLLQELTHVRQMTVWLDKNKFTIVGDKP